MFSLFRKKPEPQSIVIFDVGSGSVGAALATYDSEGLPKIRTRPRVEMPVHKELNFDRFEADTVKAFERAAEDVLKHCCRDLSKNRDRTQFAVVLASPWYVSRTKLIRLEKEKPFEVSVPFTTELIKRTLERFREEMQKNEEMENAEMCEGLIVQTFLNGYPTSSPYGKRVKTFEAALFLSAIPASLKERLTAVLEKVFHEDRPRFHTYALAAFSALRDTYPDQNDALLIDVGSEITDVLLIRNDVLTETISFPLGKNSLLRALLGAPEEARSLLQAWGKGILHEGKSRTAIERALDAWADEAEGAFEALAQEKLLPVHAFISADSDVAGAFEKALGRESFHPFTITHSALKTEILDSKELGCHLAFTGPFDPFIGLAALYLEKHLPKR